MVDQKTSVTYNVETTNESLKGKSPLRTKGFDPQLSTPLCKNRKISTFQEMELAALFLQWQGSNLPPLL
jgi:hypothetical protein